MSQAEIDAITESGGPKPQFAGNEVLTATNLNLATRHWVTTEVPGDHLGDNGDIAFVVGDAAPNSGLPGIGGWAEIEEVSGTYTSPRYEYKDANGVDWVAYEWTGDGSVKTSGGLVDALVVNSGQRSQGGTGGNAGRLVYGVHFVPATNPIDIFVATSTTSGSISGSALGSITPGTQLNHHTQPTMFTGGSRTGPAFQSNTKGAGYKSSIMGVEREYSKCYSVPNNGDLTDLVSYAYGDGGQFNSANPGGQTAMQGVVIIRVPKANAQNVTENFFRWISYATVENGVVTKVTKTPDNKPYTASAQEVECDASVQEGYLYENGEFTAPEPDYSEEIEALTARLEELRNV